jgi:hypothetical protein
MHRKNSRSRVHLIRHGHAPRFGFRRREHESSDLHWNQVCFRTKADFVSDLTARDLQRLTQLGHFVE